jgi:hypothetical protein
MAGIFMGAMGGAGEALGNIGSTMLKAELDKDARSQESSLALERAKTLEVFKQELQSAPLNRLGVKAREYAGQDVPLEPKKVTSLTGTVPQGDGTKGFVGDTGIVERAIANLPEPDRTAAMQQLRAQVAGDQQAEADAVKGKTRKRTSDEALAAAADDAKVNDLPAYAQFEKDIGKPKRDERRVDIQQEREDNRAAATTAAEQRRADQEQRRFTIDVARLELQQGNLDAQNRRIDALIDHWGRTDDRKDAAGDGSKPDKLGAIVNAMNATIKQLTEAGKGSTSEAKAEWERQYDNAVRVRNRAAALLDESLTDRGAPPTNPSPTPAPASPGKPVSALPPGSRQVGTSGGKPVYETPDGKRFIAQ